MNFFKFIQNEEITSPKQKEQHKITKVVEKKVTKIAEPKVPEDKTKNDNNYIDKKIGEKMSLEPIDLRVGMMVRVIYLENSYYNSFKGYIGEIKSFSKNKDHASIHLHACPSYKVINMPITHFQILNQ